MPPATELQPNANPNRPDAPLVASHTRPVTCIAYGETSETFVTGSSGVLRKWELSHYCVEFHVAVSPRGKQVGSLHPSLGNK